MTDQAITIEIGNVKSRIVGNMPAEVKIALYDQLAFRVQGAFFDRKFKAGVWDGKKHLITDKKQEFATGLLQRAAQLINTMGYGVEYVDKRNFGSPQQFMPLGIDDVYDYQREAINTAIDAGSGTIRIATGGGKTRVGTHVISELERPAVFLVHQRHLMYQILDVLRGRDGQPGLLMFPELVGQVGDGVYEPNVITVATVQTITSALEIGKTKAEKEEEAAEEGESGARLYKAEIEKMMFDAEVVVVDECHHVPADTIYSVMEKLQNAAYRYGLSATDWRDDNQDLLIEASFGPRVVDINLSYLINHGYLVPPIITFKDMDLPKKVLAARSEKIWNSAYAHYVTQNDAFHKQVVNQNREWFDAGRTILTLVERIEHGMILLEDMKKAGIPTVFLSGKDSVTVRQRSYDAVQAGQLRSVIATSIGDEGLDLPRLDALNLAGGSKSSTRAYQRIGRILRLFEGKTEGLVADWRCRGHEWLDKHAKTRIRIYKKEPAFQVHAPKWSHL